MSISRGQKVRQAYCAQDPPSNVQVIDLTTQETSDSEGIVDMLKFRREFNKLAILSYLLTSSMSVSKPLLVLTSLPANPGVVAKD
jgi:hypothetical protein